MTFKKFKEVEDLRARGLSAAAACKQAKVVLHQYWSRYYSELKSKKKLASQEDMAPVVSEGTYRVSKPGFADQILPVPTHPTKVYKLTGPDLEVMASSDLLCKILAGLP